MQLNELQNLQKPHNRHFAVLSNSEIKLCNGIGQKLKMNFSQAWNQMGSATSWVCNILSHKKATVQTNFCFSQFIFSEKKQANQEQRYHGF